MRNIFYILAICTLVSCDIQKKVSKSETESNLNELFERIEKREGGQASFTPVVEKHYKDTVIVVKGTNGTELKVIYDKQGNTSQIDCNGALIDVIERYAKQQNEKVTQKDKEEDYKLDLTPLIWALAGLGFVVLLMLILIAWILYKIKKPTSILPT
jgi:DNA-directed RNA polymerase subunit F